MVMSKDKHRVVCDRVGADFLASPDGLVVGLADNARTGLTPLNGLRTEPAGNATGWFIWGGTSFSQADDFFKPVHVAHLMELCPDVLPYFGLPPGWRFLVEGAYEDIWFDRSLLDEPQD